MQQSVTALPQGYGPLMKIDLMGNKKQLQAVALLQLALMVVAAFIGALESPLSATFAMGALESVAVKVLVMSVSMIAYIILHEAVHGVVIALCGAKPYFGWKGVYAYAASRAYFRKRAYLVIALAPIVFWGIVLWAICAWAGPGWFWVFYAIQIFNLSGGAGDLYVTYIMLKLPQDLWVLDNGASMQVYALVQAEASTAEASTSEAG